MKPPKLATFLPGFSMTVRLAGDNLGGAAAAVQLFFGPSGGAPMLLRCENAKFVGVHITPSSSKFTMAFVGISIVHGVFLHQHSHHFWGTSCRNHEIYG